MGAIGTVATLWLAGGLTLLVLDAFDAIERGPIRLARAARQPSARRDAVRHVAWRPFGYLVSIVGFIAATVRGRQAAAATDSPT